MPATDWQWLLIPLLAAAFSFVGAWAGVQKDISWIRRWLERHDRELEHLRNHAAADSKQ